MMNKVNDQIISWVEAHADEQLRFLIDLCDQNSYTYNKPGTDRVADMLLDRISGLFPHHQVFERSEVGNHHLLKNSNADKSIYLLGHMDTVFSPDHVFQQCQLEGDVLNGPGTGDMKGGLVVMVYALMALKSAGLMDDLPLALMLSGDEEIGSATSHDLYIEQRPNALACLVTECAGLKHSAVVSRNGKLGARLECFGQDRHVGFGTHEKSSAVLEMARKIIGLEGLNASLPGVSLNVGKIEGGLGPCTVPANASALVDVRWTEQAHHDFLSERIGALMADALPGCRSEWTVLNQRPAMPATPRSEALFARVQQIGKALGVEIPREHRRGTSDANFFGSAGVPTIDGLGPVCDKDHTVEEYILVSSLKARTALLAHLLLDLGQYPDLDETRR